MGIVTTSSETAFTQSAARIYAFVTNPENWTRTYPGSLKVAALPDHFPLQIGDTWTEQGHTDAIFTWQLALAIPNRLWVFTSAGKLGHDANGEGGMDGRITVEYKFLQPGQGITLFKRTMTIEAPKGSPLPDQLYLQTNPRRIDEYHTAIARELEGNQAA